MNVLVRWMKPCCKLTSWTWRPGHFLAWYRPPPSVVNTVNQWETWNHVRVENMNHETGEVQTPATGWSLFSSSSWWQSSRWQGCLSSPLLLDGIEQMAKKSNIFIVTLVRCCILILYSIDSVDSVDVISLCLFIFSFLDRYCVLFSNYQDA